MESTKGDSDFHRTKALCIQIPQDKIPTQQQGLVHHVIKSFLAQNKCYCVQNCCFSVFKYELLSFLSNEFIKITVVVIGYQNFTYSRNRMHFFHNKRSNNKNICCKSVLNQGFSTKQFFPQGTLPLSEFLLILLFGKVGGWHWYQEFGIQCCS